MKLKNYITPVISNVQYVAFTICATSDLKGDGTKFDGEGGGNTESPARRLYV